jgi:hypothetical protein
MNPETEKNINEAIDWLQQTGGSIQDFAAEQAPLYCREVVAWQLWTGIAACIAGILLIPLVVFCWKVSLRWSGEEDEKKKENKWHSSSDGFIGPMIGGIVAAVLALVLVGMGAPKAIKAAIAPRIVIVEHLRGLNK